MQRAFASFYKQPMKLCRAPNGLSQRNNQKDLHERFTGRKEKARQKETNPNKVESSHQVLLLNQDSF